MRLPGRTFWIAQTLGWGAHALILWLSSIPALGDGVSPFQHLPLKLAMGAGGFLASTVLHAVYGRFLPEGASGARLAATALLCSFPLGLAWALFVKVLMDPHAALGTAFRGGMNYGIALLAWSALFLTFRVRGELERETQRALRADALASEARLQMLRYQVNPHFLFNALNSLRALIDEDPARARDMVTRLAELFRYSLVDTRGKDVPLADELAAIRHYVAIQKIRFEERLHVTIEADAASEAFRLPGFLVHPLVENAVKYGMETSPMPLAIEVRATLLSPDALQVTVSNTGRWVPPERERGLVADGAGVGLANVRERLRAVSGGGSLEVAESDGRVRAVLTVRAARRGP